MNVSVANTISELEMDSDARWLWMARNVRRRWKMRTIDADDLCFVSMLDPMDQKIAEDTVNESPTIDVIPVEWINEFVKRKDIHLMQKIHVIDMVDQYKVGAKHVSD